MRARMKRRQRIRTVTIFATLAVIVVSLVVGFYFALNSGNSSLDKMIGQPLSTGDLTSLYQVSHGSYGPPGSSLLVSSGSGANLRTATGTPYVVDGKPVVVYIGGDFCPYCAAERWALVVGLSRFGNFSNLHYMTSASNEGDYATFTFTGSSFSSKYLVFTAIEQEDRDRNVIATIPANYTAGFNNAYPYVNYGNKYILETLIPNPDVLTGKNWTQIFNEIKAGDSTGVLIQEGANAVSALVCKLTNNQPSSVCTEASVAATAIGIGYSPAPSSVVLALSSSVPSPIPGRRAT